MNHHISKLFFWITSIIVILGFYISCSSTKDISKEPPYNQCIGKKFILKEDMYIFKFNDSGQYAIAPQHSGIIGLPPLVDKKYLKDPCWANKNNRHLVIKDIISKGSVFIMTQIIEDINFENTGEIFLINFENNIFSDKKIFAGAILNWKNYPFTKNWGDPPIFDANLVEPLPSDAVWWK